MKIFFFQTLEFGGDQFLSEEVDKGDKQERERGELDVQT